MSEPIIRWGIRDKTVWNWMELLIVPVMLALGATYLDMSQTAKQKALEDRRMAEAERIEDERYKTGILNDYRSAMVDLVKDSRLLSETPDTGAVDAAEAITNATLAQLDGTQKGALLSFLFHAKLIGHPYREEKVLSLFNADFSDAVLIDANLSGANLQDADLSGADLTHALLIGTHFNEDTRFAGADLGGAYLVGANGLTCEQLQETRNWDSAIRDEDLGCGRPIPANTAVYEVEEEATD